MPNELVVHRPHVIAHRRLCHQPMNYQKSYKMLDRPAPTNGEPLVEIARKMKAIEGMQPQINDMERRLGMMQSVEPVPENAINTQLINMT